MRDEIKNLLSDLMPAVDFEADFLFSHLDSLSIATILYVLNDKYGITLGVEDVTPRNFKNLDNLVRMVQSKRSMEARIQHFAETAPDTVAAVHGDKKITYGELWQAVLAKAEELRAEGLQPHRPYVFRNPQDFSFLVIYCAVHYLKAVAVPLGQFATEEEFNAVKAEVEACTFADDIRDVVYTTGTTGKSKGAMISETMLIASADNFICDLGFRAGLLFIIATPINHIASLFKIHPVLSSGATLCIIEGLKDLNVFFKVFDLPFERFATFLVPASIRMIMQFSYEKLCQLDSKIEFIETGAAPITKADMEMLAKALPHARLYNTYGGTEIGCVATYNFNDGKYMEGCVGRPLKNASVEITPEGNIIVSGQTIMSGYVGDEELTRSVIIDGKIHGSDLGYFDEEGLIHLTGRSGDVINVGGYKVNPQDVEMVAASFPGVKDCICAAAQHPVIGTILKLYVVLEEGTELDKHALAVYIKSKLEPYKVPSWYEAVPEIKRTFNGKLDRKYYKTLNQ
ncbi:MAG: AMP-binding protein [Bacteroidales bacterium]|nr:AMP-binding protein [Bacteroidales bacterium]